MRKAVTDPETIAVFLEIVCMAGKPALFCPTGGQKTFKVAIKQLRDDVFEFRSPTKLPNSGQLTIRVLTQQFQFPVNLQSKGLSLLFSMPKRLSISDPRRCARVTMEHQTQTRVTFLSAKPDLEKDLVIETGQLLDVSANGLAFRADTHHTTFERDDYLRVRFQVFNIDMDAIVSIIACNGDIYRCHMIQVDKEVQLRLNQTILSKMEMLMERHYAELKAVVNAAQQLKQLESDNQKQDEEPLVEIKDHFLDLINPVLDSVVHIFQSFMGLEAKKREVKLQRISSALYDLSAEIAFKGDKIEGSLFLCLKESTLFPMVDAVLGTSTQEINDDVRDLMGEVTNMIIGNAKKDLPEAKVFRLSTPTIISGKENMVSVFSKYTVIRITFDSPLGPFDINLYVDEVHARAMPKHQLGELDNFVFEPKVVEPILASCERIFHDFLGFEVRKKGVTFKEVLAPKFELSALINVFHPELKGKIILNLSNKMAFAVHDKLLCETKTEVDEAVRDTVAELVNIIVGNAKAEYSKMGLVYKLSIPYVIYGRNQIISLAGKIPFISSIYASNMGMFEICTSFKKVES